MNEPYQNGYTNRPGRAVAEAAGDVLEEVVSLAGLQVQLGVADFRQARAQLLRCGAVAAAAFAVIVGAVPVLLGGVALLTAELAGWPLWVALLASGGATLLVAALAAWWALRGLRRSLRVFERSQQQLRENLGQIRASLRRRDRTAATPVPTRGEPPPSQPR